jgi:hypothetical protein
VIARTLAVTNVMFQIELLVPFFQFLLLFGLVVLLLMTIVKVMMMFHGVIFYVPQKVLSKTQIDSLHRAQAQSALKKQRTFCLDFIWLARVVKVSWFGRLDILYTVEEAEPDWLGCVALCCGVGDEDSTDTL